MINKIPKKYRSMVEEISHEPDGWVVYLAPGWRYMDETHNIMEDTWKEVLEGFKEVSPCSCDECLRLLSKQEAEAH